MTKEDLRGRPALSPLEKAKRLAIKSVKLCNEVENEYNSMISLSDEERKTAHGKQVLNVAESRMDMAHKLLLILNKIDAVSASTRESSVLMSLREQRQILNEQIYQLPPLSCTYNEWEALSSEEKKMELGRPRMPLEVNLIRARINADNAIYALNKLEKEAGLEITNVKTLVKNESTTESSINTDETAGKEPGRPRLDRLGLLDKELKIIKSKIEYIKSGQAAIDQEIKLQNVKKSSSGKPLGRPFESLDDKLNGFLEEERNIVRQISIFTSKLTNEDKINRQLKLVRDELKEHKSLMLKQDLNPLVPGNTKMHAQLKALETKIDQLIEIRDGKKPAKSYYARRKEKKAQETQGVSIQDRSTISNQQESLVVPAVVTKALEPSVAPIVNTVRHEPLTTTVVSKENNQLSSLEELKRIKAESLKKMKEELDVRNAQKQAEFDAARQNEQELNEMISLMGYSPNDIEQKKVG